MIIRGKYLIGPGFQVIENGQLEIRDGYIAEVSRGGSGAAETIDLGDCLIMPGLVNGHTHLELGCAAGMAPPQRSFASWLRSMRAALMEVEGDDNAVREAVETGLSESLQNGVTLVGDITRNPLLTRELIAGIQLRPAVVSFGEVIAFGRIRDGAAGKIAAACSEACGDDRLVVGLSPHAPYTVESSALRACADAAQERELVMAIHAAEAQSEDDYLRKGRGELAELFREMGIAEGEPSVCGMGAIELLDDCGCLGAKTVLAHVNYVSDEDIRLIAERGASVAFCPRTHGAFGHCRHRFSEMLRRGVNVCLGTDSLVTSSSLSVLDEMRELYLHYPEIDPATVIEMATVRGARALGLGNICGKLASGKRADLIAVMLDRERDDNPLESVLGGGADVSYCMANGQPVYIKS